MISEVLDQDLIKANVYYGSDVVSALRDIVVKNYKYQKILFFCETSGYAEVCERFASKEYESLFLTLEDKSVGALDKIADGIKCDVRALVSVGDFGVVQSVKYIAERLGLPYIVIKDTLPIVEELIDCSIIRDGVYVVDDCSEAMAVLIDSRAVERSTRENVCAVAYSMINKLGFFEDYYLNYVVYKTGFNCGDYVGFKEIYTELYNLLEKLSMLDRDAVLRLGDMVLYLSALLKRLDYRMEKDKIFVFSNLYLLLANKEMSMYNYCMVGQIGLQVLGSVYQKFAQGVDKISFDYIDIERRVEMFDKHFQHYKVAFNAFEFPNVERIKFVLAKNKAILATKIDTLNRLCGKLLNKSFLLQEDSGYSVSKNLDSLAVIKSVCFSADVIKGECFLKIIRDYGALDMF